MGMKIEGVSLLPSAMSSMEQYAGKPIGQPIPIGYDLFFHETDGELLV
jgi:hypothetical protein